MSRYASRIVLFAWLLPFAGCTALPASPAQSLATPVITQPACGAVAKWPEQPMSLAWRSVEGARAYSVELDCRNCGRRPDPWASQSGTPWMVITSLERPQHTIDITATVRREGGNALRWRVWATDGDGHASEKTDWCLTPFSDSGLPVPGARTP